jgi:hypothetical protein
MRRHLPLKIFMLDYAGNEEESFIKDFFDTQFEGAVSMSSSFYLLLKRARCIGLRVERISNGFYTNFSFIGLRGILLVLYLFLTIKK